MIFDWYHYNYINSFYLRSSICTSAVSPPPTAPKIMFPRCNRPSSEQQFVDFVTYIVYHVSEFNVGFFCLTCYYLYHITLLVIVHSHRCHCIHCILVLYLVIRAVHLKMGQSIFKTRNMWSWKKFEYIIVNRARNIPCMSHFGLGSWNTQDWSSRIDFSYQHPFQQWVDKIYESFVHFCSAWQLCFFLIENLKPFLLLEDPK